MSRRYSMANRAKAVQDTHERIQAALVRLLGTRPYGAITIGHIAAEADVSVRSVQRHFRSKDEILRGSVGYTELLLASAFAGGPFPATPRAAIRKLVRSLFALYQQRSPEVWAAYSRAAEIPELREAFVSAIEDRARVIREIVERWRGRCRLEADAAQRLVLAMTSYTTWRSFTDFGRFNSRKAADVVSDMLCRHLLAGAD